MNPWNWFNAAQAFPGWHLRGSKQGTGTVYLLTSTNLTLFSSLTNFSWQAQAKVSWWWRKNIKILKILWMIFHHFSIPPLELKKGLSYLLWMNVVHQKKTEMHFQFAKNQGCACSQDTRNTQTWVKKETIFYIQLYLGNESLPFSTSSNLNPSTAIFVL